MPAAAEYEGTLSGMKLTSEYDVHKYSIQEIVF